MIVVVEGVSAAGKTAWCARHATATVAELTPITPPSGNAVEIAQFWTDAHCVRWREAEKMENEHGAAYCDTDPLKLHYPWCLWQHGQASAEAWAAAAAVTRVAMRTRMMGFADTIVFLEPESAVIRRQKENDPNRRRGHFELHLQIGAALRAWYEIIERLSPGRVVWHGEHVKEIVRVPPRADRFSLELFDEIVATAGRRVQ